ncbi:hypothetical protein [Nocardioides yefusunii]|uniref:Transmembrane protein n=1 Tax=Nocardioides yefusunii TaxID=2500546 RepID=A0ABW1QW34_9ACTN|nr:hypothetical protein [Nocardioides yefusunii]
MTRQNSHDPDDAAAALAAISSTRADVADRIGSPPHYYTKLGVAMALIVGAQADAVPTALSITAVVAACALLGWAVRSYIDRTGNWTMATLREPGAWKAWLMLAVMLVSLVAATVTHNGVVCVIGAVASFGVCTFLGPRWDAAWVASKKRQA